MFSAECTQIFLKEAGIHQPVDFRKGKLPIDCPQKLEEALPPPKKQLRVQILQFVPIPLSQQNNNEVVVNCRFELKPTWTISMLFDEVWAR